MYLTVGMVGAQRAKILFNGIELTYVISADELGRKLTRYKTDENGMLIHDGIDAFVTEELYGTVVIVLHPDDEKYYQGRL